MKMENENEKNRVGIYTQVSADTTAAGEGLAPQGEKSPVVTESEYINKGNNANNEENMRNKEENLKQKNENVIEVIDVDLDPQNENDKREIDAKNERKSPDVIETVAIDDDDDECIIEDDTDRKEEQSKENEKSAEADVPSQENLDEQQVDPVGTNSEDCIKNENNSEKWTIVDDVATEDGKSIEQIDEDSFNIEQSAEPQKAITRSDFDELGQNETIELERFPIAENHYGKEKWDVMIAALKKLNYLNWEINCMFQALQDLLKKRIHETNLLNELRLEKWRQIDLKRSTKRKFETTNPRDLRDIIKRQKLEHKAEASHLIPADLYTIDFRANIGDASHPKFYILPKYRSLLQDELNNFLLRESENYSRGTPLKLVNSTYCNQTLLVQFNHEIVLDFLKERLCELNGIWPGAKLVLCPRVAERKLIHIYIPFHTLTKFEILDIIKTQNKFDTNSWSIEKQVRTGDGICLHVKVDPISHLRLLHDQDDLYFLMTRATVIVP